MSHVRLSALLLWGLVLSLEGRAGEAAAATPSPGVPGVVIDSLDAATRRYVGSPSIAVLPNGRMVASHDIFGPGSSFDTTRVFRSADRGATWRQVAELKGQFWSTLFVHRRALYIMGASKRYGYVVIRRSTDGGESWTEPKDGRTGRLTDEAVYHTAPVPVAVHRGRIWRSMEERAPGRGYGYGALVMSAPADSDLLLAANWSMTNVVRCDPKWLRGLKHWREGNVVVTPKGKLVNIIRTDPRPDTAAILRLADDGKSLSFDPEHDFIDFFGGAVKFTIRFDPTTKRYWTLGSKQTKPAATRNILVLTSSADLRHWRVESHILVHPDRRHHAFQYVDWLFDGADLIAVSRTAWDGSHNFHDANHLTFHRIRDFRRRTLDDPPLNLRLPTLKHGPPREHLVAAWDFEPGHGGPLADKATAGGHRDTLTVLGEAKVDHGVATIPAVAGAALRAADSDDLALPNGLTIWLRLRVARNPKGFLSLVGKRQFKNPERRSYGLFITPDAGRPHAFGIGGQMSFDGTSGGSITLTKAHETVPVGQWATVAMTLRRQGYGFVAEWLASPGDGQPWRRVGGPVGHPCTAPLFRSKIPLLLGNNVHLRANPSPVELDEVRLYDRALTREELAAVVPGELSKEEGHR